MQAIPSSVVSLRDWELINSLPCGGKAKGLSKLFEMGARVPNGICVIQDVCEPETAYAINQWLCDNATANPEVTYAVRSSAMCEDGEHRSFAGMFSTFLNIRHTDVIGAAILCQRSGENQRAKAYAGFSSSEAMRIPVVIQEMVRARAAGVCFTANPLTKNTQEIAIEVALGMGERLVSGSVTPEYWLIDHSDRIVDMQRGDDALAGQTILTYSEIRTLAGEARSLAAKFGHPLDIEFAFGDAELYMLQARPITTLAFSE